MRTKKVGKIILSKVLEMPLKRYLAFIEKTMNGTSQPPAACEPLKEKMVYAKTTMKDGVPYFMVSDLRLQKTFPVNQNTDEKTICSIKWINTRNKFSLHILRSLLHYQREYWISGKETDLKPLTCRRFLSFYPLENLDPSRLSRLVSTLLVITPQNQNISLRSLFISKKHYAYIIKEIIDSSEGVLKDKDIQHVMEQRGIHLSIRTICSCRKLLNIPNYKRRAGQYYGKGVVFSDYIMLIEKKYYRFPAEPGVYELSVSCRIDYHKNKSDVVYIGSSQNLRKRIANYSGNKLKNNYLNGIMNRMNGCNISVRFCINKNYHLLERELLKNFRNNYGMLPMANNIGG